MSGSPSGSEAVAVKMTPLPFSGTFTGPPLVNAGDRFAGGGAGGMPPPPSPPPQAAQAGAAATARAACEVRRTGMPFMPRLGS
ncbi:MAG: hypothetical protein ACXWU1_06565 [Allosphingosinicella sp.]